MRARAEAGNRAKTCSPFRARATTRERRSRIHTTCRWSRDHVDEPELDGVLLASPPRVDGPRSARCLLIGDRARRRPARAHLPRPSMNPCARPVQRTSSRPHRVHEMEDSICRRGLVYSRAPRSFTSRRSWPDPHRFDPLASSRKPSPFETLWGGSRSCLGKPFAVLQMRLTMRLVQRASIQLAPRCAPKPAALGILTGPSD